MIYLYAVKTKLHFSFLSLLSSSGLKKMVAILITSVFLQSCATIFTGTKDIIRFDSTPQGAKVQIDGIDKGKAPCDVSVKISIDSKTVTYKGISNNSPNVKKKRFEHNSLKNYFNRIENNSFAE